LNDGELLVELSRSARQLVVINLEPVMEVNVRVVDENGSPAPKALVHWNRKSGRADSNGELVLRLKPEEQRLRASASGHADSEVTSISPDAGIKDVVLRLRASFPISGVVRAPGNDRISWLWAGWRLADDGGTDCDDLDVEPVEVDPTRRFRIETSAPGTYLLCAFANDFEPVLVNAPGSVELAWIPQEARRRSHAVTLLAPGTEEAAEDDPVAENNNNNHESTADRRWPSGRSREITLRAPGIEQALVGISGSIERCATLPGGPNTLRALCPVRQLCLLVLTSQAVGRVCLPASDDPTEHEVVLRTGAYVGGQATRGDKPASGLTAHLQGPTERKAVTDSEGAFYFEALPSGTYSLQVGSFVVFKQHQLDMGGAIYVGPFDIEGTD
jgi:hypothetical protein